MALARLGTSRFSDEAGQNTADATSRSIISDATSAGNKSTVMGSTSARFLGEYNPELNKPIPRREMNTGITLLPELTAELEKLRKVQATQNHKTKDELKKFLNESARFTGIYRK